MLWLRNWEFCQEYGCLDGEPAPDLRGRFSAEWLREFQRDAFKMVAMRTLLLQQHSAWQIAEMSDETVIDQIAQLVIAGRLHIHIQPEQPVSYAPVSEPAKIVPFPISERKPRPETFDRAPVRELPTFSDIDGSAQAATLVAAAASGAPFCPE